MFSSKADKPAKKANGNKRPMAPSSISGNLTIAGNLSTEGEVQIDGTVEGDVSCCRLTIGEHATVTGEIAADEVVVRGQIDGRIRAKKVELTSTARVNGDIWHDSLAIEAGAFLDGHCRRNGSEEPAHGLKVFEGSSDSSSLQN